LDVGFVGSAYQGTSTTQNAANTGGTQATGTVAQKQNTSGFGQSAESSSRLGFKGTEDLGGGTQALFTVEVSLSPDSNGASYASTTNLSQPGVFGSINRQTFVGLHKNGLGTATIGTQYTPMFDVQSTTDAAGNNNLIGNAVYSASLQSAGGTYNQGLGPFTAATAGLDAFSSAYSTRVSNALKVQSDRISGLQAELLYAQTNQNQTQAGNAYAGGATLGGTNNNTAWGVNLDYVWNKLQVVAATQNIKSFDPANLTATSGISGTANLNTATANNFGTNISDQQTYAAGTYDFGILKSYLQYSNRRQVSQQDGSYTSSRSAWQVGVRSSLTSTIQAYATMGLGKSQYLGQGNLGNNNFRTAQLGADYFLSKRTNLYVAYGSVNQSASGPQTVSSITNINAMYAATPVSGTNYALGIRHTF
jgi:predicted porin